MGGLASMLFPSQQCIRFIRCLSGSRLLMLHVSIKVFTLDMQTSSVQQIVYIRLEATMVGVLCQMFSRLISQVICRVDCQLKGRTAQVLDTSQS
jgi:hypothetical protein